MWFAAADGLFRYDGVVWSVLNEDDGLGVLGFDIIQESPAGTYWTGGYGGLTRYQPRARTLPPPELTIRTRADKEYPPGTKIDDPISTGQLVGLRSMRFEASLSIT